MSIEDEGELPVPKNVVDDKRKSQRPEMLVQERIFGHRFKKDQAPYMILLETIAVCASVPLGEVPANSDSHEKISYELKHLREMRYILFFDNYINQIQNDKQISKQKKWPEWKEKIGKRYRSGTPDPEAFNYLDASYNDSLPSLSQAVQLLRSQELDVPNGRRPTSKFLALNGLNTICVDLRGSSGAWEIDRRFFGRGGELVYLMLNRSSSAHLGDLSKKIEEKFLSSNNWKSRIADSLTKVQSKPNDISNVQIGYLPCVYHKVYDVMATNWRTVLEAKDAPSSFLFESLVCVTGLNLISYFVQRASKVTQQSRTEPIFLDLTNGSNANVRGLAKNLLSRHRKISDMAVEDYIVRKLNESGKWKKVNGDACKAWEVLKCMFEWDGNKELSPDDQVQSLIEKAKKRSHNNVQRCILPITKGIGLATTRSGVGSWFCASDSMIIALVMANVNSTCELSDFTRLLYDRYKIVIGPSEARHAFDTLPIGIKCFEENLISLEDRMRRLSLTKRLSDDCAFVTNPWHREDGICHRQ